MHLLSAIEHLLSHGVHPLYTISPNNVKYVITKHKVWVGYEA